MFKLGSKWFPLYQDVHGRECFKLSEFYKFTQLDDKHRIVTVENHALICVKGKLPYVFLKALEYIKII